MFRDFEQVTLSQKVLPGTPGASEHGQDVCGEVVELVFSENRPLGIEVYKRRDGLLKVSEFVKDSQAIQVCRQQNLDPLSFVGAFIVGMNGNAENNESGGDFYELLKDPSRPKVLRFELRQSDSHVSHGRDDIVENDKKNEVELVFRENRPLGVKFGTSSGGHLIVVEFPPESQAETVCQQTGYDQQTFIGATIVGVNRRRYEDGEDMREALKTPARPKAVLFRLKRKRFSPRNLFAAERTVFAVSPRSTSSTKEINAVTITTSTEETEKISTEETEQMNEQFMRLWSSQDKGNADTEEREKINDGLMRGWSSTEDDDKTVDSDTDEQMNDGLMRGWS